ncbi:uncharacterized protein EDB91DRAFT_1253621 [Suillus paluster]|uniref:uncharacterized protein n=1 Tax=Suillus paluster TaxID=48578 RepID=UPI001B87E74E|nr:uncharacterized protein EDB91DRAFT_1253621 [Suillus paluster]KAG1728036.1 hypothetical protein EDB91DRAFT_1253621 [Suillus paluster]
MSMLTRSTEPDIITFPGGIHPRKSILVWQVPYHMTPSTSSLSCPSTTFYTSLLEEPSLCSFRSGWLEALANLVQGPALTTDAVSKVATDIEPEKECLGKSSPFTWYSFISLPMVPSIFLPLLLPPLILLGSFCLLGTVLAQEAEGSGLGFSSCTAPLAEMNGPLGSALRVGE